MSGKAGGTLESFYFDDDGAIPNNPVLPLIIFPQAIDLDGASDPAAAIEAVFQRHGWGDGWRNGVYPFVHYHARIHEALGVARGRARVRFGGDKGVERDLRAGDVAVLPAGTGHQCISASTNFLVVGAYPPNGEFDLCRGTPAERERALVTIPRVPLPASDPVQGREGPLIKLWTADRAGRAPNHRGAADTT